ncbi:MAG TPA: hypothetical protein VFO40_22710 [Chthoniobacterales bacterium]|nr:hypothetical protein [Chthoniobacterales bacterium]
MPKTQAELEAENAALRQQLAELQVKGTLEPMALKRRIRADALVDVENRYRKAFPQGHKSDEELESFFSGLARHLFDPGTAYHRDAEHKDTRGGAITVNPVPQSDVESDETSRAAQAIT